MKRIGITTDCVCDLPDDYLRLHDIGIVYFYITTDRGHFKDGYEITSGNIIEYLEDGGEKAETNAPEPKEYRDFFHGRLKKYDELIHISISSKVSLSYKNATTSLALMGGEAKKIHVIDSKHLSTGMGHLVIKAVEMRDLGKSVEEICGESENLIRRISTSFITYNADYLYRNGRVSKFVRDLSSTLKVHPILTLKDGAIVLKTLKIGNYEKSVAGYIRGELRHSGKIEKRRVFITHAGCAVKMIADVKEQVERRCAFEEVVVTKASATISGNCGPGTVGVLFIYE